MGNRIEIIKEKVKGEIKSKSQPSSIYEFLLKNALESMLNDIEEIEKALKVEKFNLIFIGKIGSGKTTAICHLFNLIGEFEDKDKKGKTIKKTLELFPTGSGRTTICEVIVQSSDKTYIEIEPYTENELKELVELFAETIFSKTKGDEHSNDKQSSSKGVNLLSDELDRALRNVLDLRRKSVKDTESDKSEKYIDEAEEECKELIKKGLELKDFKEFLISRINFPMRIMTRIDYSKSISDEKKWIKNTVSDLNVAKIAEFSIPKKIFIHASSDVLNVEKLTSFNSVIDTKGLDLNKFRKELDEYIASHNSICLFVSQFPAAPDKEIFELMITHLKFKSKKYNKKFILFVLPRKEEPEKVVGPDGVALNDWDMGIQQRTAAIKDDFYKAGVEIDNTNILFYDSHKYYMNDRLIQDYSLEDVVDDRDRIMNEISRVIELRSKSLNEEIDSLEKDLELIVAGNSFSKEQEDIINATIEKINGFTNLNFYNAEEFKERFIGYYNETYPRWNTKHAINRRYGNYQERNFEIFYDGYGLTKELVREVTENYHEQLLEIIEILMGNFSNDNVSALIEQIKNDLEKNYDKFIDSISKIIYEYLKNTTFYPLNESSDFWFNVINRKGKGSGYTEDVLLMYRNQMRGVELFLKNETEKLWKSMIINKLLLFFGKS